MLNFEQEVELGKRLKIWSVNPSELKAIDLSQEDISKYRGDFNNPGINSPYRDRSIEENLELFENMKNGKKPLERQDLVRLQRISSRISPLQRLYLR